MFGIEDPAIWLAYLASVACLVFAVWFGITHWNKESADEDDHNPENRGS